MRFLRCEQETGVSRAARTGLWSGSLRQHLDTCSTCAETCAVTEALLREPTPINLSSHPDASDAWLEARRRARLHLRRRARSWFRALRTLTLVYLPAMLLWSFSHYPKPAAADWKLSLHAEFAPFFSFAIVPFAVGGALLALLCASMGCWYLLREARATLLPSG